MDALPGNVFNACTVQPSPTNNSHVGAFSFDFFVALVALSFFGGVDPFGSAASSLLSCLRFFGDDGFSFPCSFFVWSSSLAASSFVEEDGSGNALFLAHSAAIRSAKVAADPFADLCKTLLA